MGDEWIAFGLRIASAFEIPGGHPVVNAGGPPDLRVVRGVAGWPEGEGGVRLGPYRLDGETLLFEAAGVGRYRFDAAASLLTVEPAPESEAEAVSALLIATALPAALWMRGDLMLHAAAAVLPGCERAVGFAAASGFGKTHLLGRLLAEGAAVLADDVLCVRAGAVSSGLPGCLFARIEGRLPRERRRVEVPGGLQRSEAGLGALLLLTADGDAVPRRLHGAEALAAVTASFHRPLVPRLLGRLPELLPRVAELLDAVAVYRWSPPADGRVLGALEPLAGLLQGDAGEGA